MSEKRIIDLASRLRELKTTKDEIEDSLSVVNAEIKNIQEKDLPGLMQDAGVASMKLEGVGTLYLRSEVRIGLKAEDRQTGYQWLAENGHGDLIVEYVWPKTLQSFAREQLEKGVTMPAIFNATYVSIASLRK